MDVAPPVPELGYRTREPFGKGFLPLPGNLWFLVFAGVGMHGRRWPHALQAFESPPPLVRSGSYRRSLRFGRLLDASVPTAAPGEGSSRIDVSPEIDGAPAAASGDNGRPGAGAGEDHRAGSARHEARRRVMLSSAGPTTLAYLDRQARRRVRPPRVRPSRHDPADEVGVVLGVQWPGPRPAPRAGWPALGRAMLAEAVLDAGIARRRAPACGGSARRCGAAAPRVGRASGRAARETSSAEWGRSRDAVLVGYKTDDGSRCAL
jgi:hypothetical protein